MALYRSLPGVIAVWSLDDATAPVTDLISAHHSGAINGITLGRPGLLPDAGHAASKDANNGGRISIPPSEDWRFGTGDFWIALWVNANDVNKTNSWTMLGGNIAEFYVMLVAGRVRVSCQQHYETGATDVADGRTHLLLVSRDAGTVSVWIDGSSSPDLTASIPQDATIAGPLSLFNLTVTDYGLIGAMNAIAVGKGAHLNAEDGAKIYRAATGKEPSDGGVAARLPGVAEGAATISPAARAAIPPPASTPPPPVLAPTPAAAPAPATRPAAPGSLIAWPSDGNVTLAWEPVAGAITFNLYRQEPGCDPQLIKSALPERSYIDSGLKNGRRYLYRVSAINSYGQSDPSAEASAIPRPIEAPRLFPRHLTAAREKARANTPQWRAFRARLIDNLPKVLSYSYQGSMATWISDYAAGAVCEPDPAMAQNFADKAIGLMISLTRDYQYGAELSRAFLARADGKIRSFDLPESDLIPSSLAVFVYQPVVLKLTRSAANGPDGLGSPYYSVLKVSKSSDGAADYAEGIDWRVPTNQMPQFIDWSSGSANQPAPGETYYVTAVAVLGAAARPAFVLKGRTLTFASTPAAGTAIFCEYIHGTHATDGSTLAYQQTGRGYGGFDNALIDTGYSIRYMGKHMAMGLDWLWSNPGMTATRRDLFMRLMVRWADYFRDNGYQRDCAGSNYGVGGLVGRTFTAVALAGRDRQNGPRLLSEVTAYRDHITSAFLLHDTNPANLMTPATLRGGYWPEGWNYGALGAENLLYCGLALEESGCIPAAQMERAWATQLVSQLLIGSSDAVEGAYPTQIVDFGDSYTYPASFPSPPLLAIVSDAANDDKARSHANYLLQYASKQANPDPLANDYRELLFHDPTQPCAFWSELPLHWRAGGVELLCMRSAWGRNAVWAAASFGNLLDAGHQPVAAGALEVRRGVDDLLIYGPAYAKDAVAFQEKTAAANTLVVDDGGAGAQNYRYQQGVWTGTPGNHVIAYEATNRWVYAAADLRTAYSLNTHPGEGGSVSEWVRSLVYLRPGYFVVHDRCTTNQPSFTKAVRWHAQRGKARLQGDQLQASVGSSRAFVQPYSSAPLSVQLGTHTTDGVVMDEATVQIADPMPRVRYLHAIQVGPSTASEMDTNAYIQSAEAKLEGIIIGSNVVMFAHTPPWGGADRYTVSAKTGEEIRHTVVGLPPDTEFPIVVGGSLTRYRTSSQGVLTFSTAGTGAPQIVSLTADAPTPR